MVLYNKYINPVEHLSGVRMRELSDISKEKNELLEKLFIKYSKLMHFVAFDILKDKYLAEDAVQKSFLKLKRSNINIDSISSNRTRSFMVIVIRNISLNMLNISKREPHSIEVDEFDELPDKALPPLELLINREKVSQVKSNLRLLKNKYADVFLLRYFNDFSITEIASLLDISEQLVRVRLYRAKKMILEKING
jgi:RNA polymerase sigma-70 factor, ECF subfamily